MELLLILCLTLIYCFCFQICKFLLITWGSLSHMMFKICKFLLITWGSLSHIMFPVWILNFLWRCTCLRPLLYMIWSLHVWCYVWHHTWHHNVEGCSLMLSTVGFDRKTHQVYSCTELSHLTLYSWFYLIYLKNLQFS